MRTLAIVCVMFLVGLESKVAKSNDEIDQELQIHNRTFQNFLTYLVEEKERLEKEIAKVRDLVLQTRGASLTDIRDLETKLNATMNRVQTWEAELKLSIENNSDQIEHFANATLQDKLSSYVQYEELEVSFNQSQAEAALLRDSRELCEAKIESLNSKVRNLTETMQHIKTDIIKKLVRTFNSRRVWRSLRVGLEAVLDPSSTAYSQLQGLGYDETYPLKKASEKQGYEDLLELLLDAGLDADMAVAPGDGTMLHCSAYERQLSTIELLLRHGAHTEMRNSDSRTPLVMAAWYDIPASLKLLVDRGAYVNSVDNVGRTGLHWAAVYDYLEIAKYLVDNGVLTAARDSGENTALDLAGDNSVGAYLSAYNS